MSYNSDHERSGHPAEGVRHGSQETDGSSAYLHTVDCGLGAATSHRVDSVWHYPLATGSVQQVCMSSRRRRPGVHLKVPICNQKYCRWAPLFAVVRCGRAHLSGVKRAFARCSSGGLVHGFGWRWAADLATRLPKFHPEAS